MQDALLAANELSAGLRMSSRGEKRSSSGSAKGAPASKKEVPAADDVVEVIIVHTPDGRCCKICWRKDSDEDPVDKALGLKSKDGKMRFMSWAYPPRDGKTRGDYCYFCIRIYLREGKAAGLTFEQWGAQIAAKGPTGVAGHEEKALLFVY